MRRAFAVDVGFLRMRPRPAPIYMGFSWRIDAGRPDVSLKLRGSRLLTGRIATATGERPVDYSPPAAPCGSMAMRSAGIRRSWWAGGTGPATG